MEEPAEVEEPAEQEVPVEQEALAEATEQEEPAEPRDGDEPLPLGDRARMAIILIGLVILTDLGSLLADLHQYSLISQVIDGEPVTLKELSDSDDRVGLMATVNLIANVLAAVTFLLWYSRAYRNIIAMGIGKPRFGTRWAVAYWFIPIANLMRPLQVMNDIWRGSDPDLPRSGAGWSERKVPALFGWWWAAWLIAGVAGNTVARNLFENETPTPEQLRSESARYIFADITHLIAAVLVIIVIRRITARQQERRELFEAGTLPA